MSASRFDEAAASWDENPVRVALARAIAAAVRAQAPVRETMTAIDYGCGTGLVTLALQPCVRQITGIDSSTGMLAVLREKMAALGVTNVETLALDLTTQAPPPGLRADLIVSAMTLHHIADVPRLLGALIDLLTPGGYLALADLETEAGNFHQENADVHHFGFDPGWLAGQLRALGLDEVRTGTAHVIERPTADGSMGRFPVFLVSGRKPAG